MKIPKNIKNNDPLRWFSYASIALTPLIVGYSQTSESEKEEIFELSPFEVSAENDVGYRATSTLAGSRLNTQLKDVPASITVLTGEFLDDLGATDIETAMAYVAGVETSLTSDFSTVTNGVIDSAPNAQKGNNRVRGLDRADVTMDFFGTSGGFDRYNTQRVAMVRGPNSTLFGLGSPAGIINYTTKKANTNKNSGEVDLRFDNFGSLRGTFDVNRVINDKLAFRAMFMQEKQRNQFDHAFENDRRFSAAITYRPFKNTTIRGFYENAESDGNRVRYSTPRDAISAWVAAGRPTWDPYAQAGVSEDNLVLSDFNNFNSTMVQGWDATSSNPLYSTWASSYAHGGLKVDADGSTIRNTVRSSHPLEEGKTVGEIVPNVTDPRIFPIFDWDLGTYPGNHNESEFQKYSLTINQKITDNLHLELAGYRDDGSSESLGQSGKIS